MWYQKKEYLMNTDNQQFYYNWNLEGIQAMNGSKNSISTNSTIEIVLSDGVIPTD